MRFCTLVEVGNLKGDLESTLKKYSNEFIPIPGIREDVTKYMLQRREGENRYIMMVSKNENPPCMIKKDYDFMISVQGTNENRAKEMIIEFREKTGIQTRDAPKHLHDLFDNINRLFGIK